MKQAFPRIGLMGKPNSGGTVATLDGLVTFCGPRHQLTVDLSTSALLQHLHPNLHCREDVAAESDSIIVVGGDGSLLRAARSAVDHQTPCLVSIVGDWGFSPTFILQRSTANSLISFLGTILRKSDRSYALKDPLHEHQLTGLALNDVILRAMATRT